MSGVTAVPSNQPKPAVSSGTATPTELKLNDTKQVLSFNPTGAMIPPEAKQIITENMKQVPSFHPKGAMIPPEAKQIITENMKQVLEKLGNITEVIVQKNNEMKGAGKDTSNLVRSLDEAHVVLDKLAILK